MLTGLRSRVLPCVVVPVICCWLTVDASKAQSIEPPPSRPADLPRSANWVRLLSGSGSDVFRDQRKLWILPAKESLDSNELSLPRLCASIRSVYWSDDAARKTKITPEPDVWKFSWKGNVAAGGRIEVTFDSEAVLPAQRTPAKPAGDGTIMLHANQASTFGEMLRFEPQSYKNTVGYWTVPTDYVTWELEIDEPAEYSIGVLQGCGAGQGGSVAKISLHAEQSVVGELEFQTVETGHFQNFQWNHLGRIKVKESGTYQLRITPVRIAKAALFDVRMLHLVKQAKPEE